MPAYRALPSYMAPVLCLALVLGCGGADRPKGDLPPLVPARGEVTKGAKPVSGGFVQFRAVKTSPAENNLIVTSAVGADGRFELSTTHALSQTKAPGAPAGDYTVTYLPPGETQDAGPVALPGKVTITSGENNLTLKLDGP